MVRLSCDQNGNLSYWQDGPKVPSPSDINDVAFREDLLRDFATETEMEAGKSAVPHVNDITLEYIFNFAYTY